jgi:hypothetical protein
LVLFWREKMKRLSIENTIREAEEIVKRPLSEEEKDRLKNAVEFINSRRGSSC